MSNSQFMEIWSMLDRISKKLDTLVKYEEKQTEISSNQPKADEKTDQQNPPLMPFRL